MISLNIYDVQGRMVQSLITDDYFSSGHHQVTWDGKNNMGIQLPSGMYFYKLMANHQSLTKKMVIMK